MAPPRKRTSAGAFPSNDMCDEADGKVIETGVQEKTIKFDWIVNNFGLIRQHDFMIAEQKMEFEVVDANDVKTKWRLALTKSTDSDEWIGLRRSLLSSNDPLGRSSRTIMLVKINGYVSLRSDGIMEIKPGGYLFFNKLISKDWKTPDDGKVTISIEFTIYSVMPTKKRSLSESAETRVQGFKKSCKERSWTLLSSLVGDAATSDVTIISKDDKRFPAHRIILAKASPVFEKMFQTDMLEKKSGVIKCDDLTGRCVQLLMNFIYTGNLPDKLEDWTQTDILLEFIYAAGKYQLEGLLTFLDESLGTLVKVEDAPKFLSLANKLSLKKAQKDLYEGVVKLSTSGPDRFFEVFNAMHK